MSKLKNQNFQVAIVGGGINGAVSAAALAAGSVKVALIDRGDFAGVTSQESSNMVLVLERTSLILEEPTKNYLVVVLLADS